MSQPLEMLEATLRSSRSWELRRDAARQMGQMGNACYAEPLVAALKDQVKHVRAAAAEALGKIADARTTIPLLLAAADTHREVSQKACQALQRIAAREIDPILAALKDSNYKVRQQAAKVLGLCADNRAIQPLMDLLTDRFAGQEAAAALGNIGDRQVLQPLVLAALGQQNCLTALDKIDPDWRTSAEAQACVPDIIAGLRHQNWQTRLNAVGLLEQIVPDWTLGKEARQQVPDFIAALRNPDPLVRHNAYRYLEKIDPDWATSPAAYAQRDLFVEALRHEDPSVRCYAAEVLGLIADPAAVGPLIEALKVNDADVTDDIVLALERIGDKRCVEALVARLKAEYDDNFMGASFQPHTALAQALGFFGTAEATGMLIWQLRMSWSVSCGQEWVEGADQIKRAEQCYQTTLQALVQIGPGATAGLIASLADEWSMPWMDGALKVPAQVLDAIDPHWGQAPAAQEIVPALADHLETDKQYVREEVSDLLCRIGGPRVIKAMQDLIARTKNSAVADDARDILDMVSGVGK
jgi:HEAT repeat protein